MLFQYLSLKNYVILLAYGPIVLEIEVLMTHTYLSLLVTVCLSHQTSLV